MKKKSSPLNEAILETADDMLGAGLFSRTDHEKITKRHFKKAKLPQLGSISSKQIKAIREEAHLSQAVFASCLNLTVGYVSQLERGVKKPTGAVLVLLNVIRRNGFSVLLQ